MDMMKVFVNIETRIKLFWFITGLAIMIGVGVIDFLTGFEVSLSLLYLVPITLVAWYGGRSFGIVIAIISALTWLGIEIASGHTYSHPAYVYWNSAVRFGFFLIVTLLLSIIRNALDKEKELARIDYLTGAVNALFFSELLHTEIERLQRYKHPFTLAYIDLDNFKTVNDHYGHSVGDKVLSTIVKNSRSQLRKIDVIARLGGDEFAILLPETDQPEARAAISKIYANLLDEMRSNNWPVTFSIGVLTCRKIPQSTDELIKQADYLMYSVKNNGKNSINYSIYAG